MGWKVITNNFYIEYMQSLNYYIEHPKEFVGCVCAKLNRLFVNDELYLKLLFGCFQGYRLDLKCPRTFNEKLQWLKLYNRKPEYTKMVDKYAVKEYVAEKIGEQYIISTLGVWDRVEDIDWDSLPQQFVLKTTHAGGGNGVVLCRDKSTFDRNLAIAKLHKSMNTNPYYPLREWPYKNVKPRVIAEQYLVDESGVELKDYKFFCFNGEVRLFKVDFNRQNEHRANYYDTDWNLLPLGEVSCPPNTSKVLQRPDNFESMLILASKLSQNIPFVRVDFYNVRGKVYFGEITFFPASGMAPFNSKDWDYMLGSWIELPNKQNI